MTCRHTGTHTDTDRHTKAVRTGALNSPGGTHLIRYPDEHALLVAGHVPELRGKRLTRTRAGTNLHTLLNRMPTNETRAHKPHALARTCTHALLCHGPPATSMTSGEVVRCSYNGISMTKHALVRLKQ